ncbi:MAG: hypothetical protein IPG50_20715 [Myxococcales bacterium]|nr:hypothetical protein [Myxococcales bacterium]
MTTVNALDLGVTLVVSGWVAAMMLYPFARNDELYLALAANGFFAIARSFFLPASPRRTAALATLGAVPPLVATLYIAANDAGRLTLPRAPFVVNVAFALLVPVVLAWVGATVIAGLFAEVRAARRLGQYTLDGEKQEGGMGVVHRAHHAMRRPRRSSCYRRRRAARPQWLASSAKSS